MVMAPKRCASVAELSGCREENCEGRPQETGPALGVHPPTGWNLARASREWSGARPQSGAGSIAHEIVIVGQLSDLPPQIFVVTEGKQCFPDFLKVGVGFRDFRIDVECCAQR